MSRLENNRIQPEWISVSDKERVMLTEHIKRPIEDVLQVFGTDEEIITDFYLLEYAAQKNKSIISDAMKKVSPIKSLFKSPSFYYKLVPVTYSIGNQQDTTVKMDKELLVFGRLDITKKEYDAAIPVLIKAANVIYENTGRASIPPLPERK